MDSAGNEVIIVDDRAQTNGFNGNYSGIIEEVSEMKTRSKASGGPGEAAKLRSSSRTNAATSATSNVSNSYTKNDASAATPASAIAPGAAPSSVISGSAADKDKKMNLRSGLADPQAESASVAGKAGDPTVVAGGSKKIESTPAAPKSTRKGAGSVGGDREDDSGINSRSSSVSTDDTYSSRLRTRSKRTEAALSSSTPASTRKAASRMPLSTYDFDDDSIILEEDPTTSGSSLKRKATKVLVEEMEDDEAGKEDDEPPAKVTVIQRSSFFSVLLNPLKAIRGRIFVGSQQQPEPEKTSATDEAASQTSVSKVIDEAPQTEHAASQTELHNEASTATDEDAKEATSTCMVM